MFKKFLSLIAILVFIPYVVWASSGKVPVDADMKIDILYTVLSGLVGGGFVSAMFFFILNGFSERLKSIEATMVTKEHCNAKDIDFTKTLDAFDNSVAKNLDELDTGKVDTGLCVEVRDAFKKSLHDMILVVQTLRTDFSETSKQLGSIETALTYINLTLQEVKDQIKKS